jgi:hypothetical protein
LFYVIKKNKNNNPCRHVCMQYAEQTLAVAAKIINNKGIRVLIFHV